MANWKATENGAGERKYHPDDVISFLLKDPGASVVLADSDGSDEDILTTKHADSESEVDRSLSESDEEESFFFAKLLSQDADEEGTAGISSLLLTPTAVVEPVSDEEESSMQVRAVDTEETARTSPAMTPASVAPTAGKSLHSTQRSSRTAATTSVTPARDPSAPRTSGLQLGRRAAPSRWVNPLSASSDDIDSSDSEFCPPPKRKAVSRPASKGNRGDGGATATSQSAGGVSDEERWHDRESDDEQPEPLTFNPHRPPGPTIDRQTSWTPLSLFQLFFSHSVMLTLINNTNSNAAKRIASGMKFAWKTLTLKEFYTFLAIVLFSALVHVHHRADLWKKQYPYNFKFPGDRMSRNRWESIMWSLHLSNPDDDEENTRKKGTSSYDRLFKIKPLYTEIVSACQAHFQPYQNIAIDERMVASRARVHIKQYMKNKPAKWGFKLYVLADSSTAYTWNFFVYSGTRSESEPVKGKGLSYSSVMDLLPFGLLGTGYKLFVDNVYTSPALFHDLAERKFGCCGTIRKDHVGLPKTTVNDLGRKAERGDLRWIRKDSLLFVKWMDSRQVNICSSLHKAYSGQTARRPVKEAGVWSVKDVPVPDAMLDYNVNMGGVDLSDALIGYYSVHHKTMKWYKTFFFHFLDIAVVNGFLLHKELCKIKRERPLAHKAFAETLIREMIEFSHGQGATELEPCAATCMPCFYGSDGSESRRYCAMCKKAGRGEKMKTPVYCRRCEVALCSIPKRNCFVEWHDSM